jgi:hypothetical protein
MPFKTQITAKFAVPQIRIYCENYKHVLSRCVWGLFKFRIKRDVFWNHLSCPRSMGCCTQACGDLNWLAGMFCKQQGSLLQSQLWEHVLNMLYFPVPSPCKISDSYYLSSAVFLLTVQLTERCGKAGIIWEIPAQISAHSPVFPKFPLPLSPSIQIPG